MKFNYKTIKELAKREGRLATDYVVLAVHNDPFYCGQKRQVEGAEWFADQWQKLGYRAGVHLRRMHYQLVSQSPAVMMAKGEPYENTLECWDELCECAKNARNLGLVDAEAIIDRRNGEAVTRYVDERKSCIEIKIDTGAVDAEFYEAIGVDAPMPDLEYPTYEATLHTSQPYHIEIWCEKSTMDDILTPLARGYHAVLQYGMGELSISIAVQALRRFERIDKPVRIFYISDFDPSGLGMPVGMARKLEFYMQELGLDLDIKLFPIILTAEQAKHYNLPRTPIKDGERRKATFEERFGVGATELDALEANHPGEFEKIVRTAIENYYDVTLSSEIANAKKDLEQELEEIQSEIYDTYQEDIERVKVEYEKLWHTIKSELAKKQSSVDLNDLPVAKQAVERDDALFDSSRGYLEQLSAYKGYQGKEEVNERKPTTLQGIDEVDEKIIKAMSTLRGQRKKPNANAISPIVGVSVQTCYNRIARMKSMGVL